MEEIAHLKVHWMKVLISWVVMSNLLFVGQGSCRKRKPEKELNFLSLTASPPSGYSAAVYYYSLQNLVCSSIFKRVAISPSVSTKSPAVAEGR